MAERFDADALRALEQRLDRAAAAAERLLSEAGAAAVGGSVPLRGWQHAGAEGAESGAGGAGGAGRGWIDPADAELLFSLLAGVRDRIPAELQQRLAAALREVLQALRALIDWCLERAERRQAAPTEVQDIPIL